MIRYALKCDQGHDFESWFQSSERFDALAEKRLVTCPACSSSDIRKSLMAPGIAGKESANRPLVPPASAMEEHVRRLKDHIEKNSEDVGTRFATEARAIHDGDAPARAIHGQAKLEEAKSLIEDGVPVAPLPWIDRKAN